MSKIGTIKVDRTVSSYNKLKWKNGRDIGEYTFEIVIYSADPAYRKAGARCSMC